MLREFVESQHRPRPQTSVEYLKETTQAFDACVDFLRDPNRFPNTEINQLVILMWRLIGNGEIPITIDVTGSVPAFIFTVLGSGVEIAPLYIIPRDFLTQVDSNAAQQLGVIAYMASQGRDYYTGKVKEGKSKEVNLRAQGYEAEALLTLHQMGKTEGINLNWIPFQQDILHRFPQGLKSLPSGMVYPTPIYMRPRGNG